MLRMLQRKKQVLIKAPDRMFSLLVLGYSTGFVAGFVLLAMAWIFSWNDLKPYGGYLLYGSLGAFLLNAAVGAITATLLGIDIDKSIEDVAKDAIKSIDSAINLEQVELVLKHRFIELARSEEETDRRVADLARALERI